MAYTEQLQKKKGKEVECLIDFLEGLGLPKKASLEMELGHLQKIVNTIAGQPGK
tara:strand:+ start:3313 stop:3474 length:162 start_codon:yes stop_codon:yes gene_type:complete